MNHTKIASLVYNVSAQIVSFWNVQESIFKISHQLVHCEKTQSVPLHQLCCISMIPKLAKNDHILDKNATFLPKNDR